MGLVVFTDPAKKITLVFGVEQGHGFSSLKHPNIDNVYQYPCQRHTVHLRNFPLHILNFLATS